MIKEVADAIKDLDKIFGEGSVIRLGDSPLAGVEVISTGIPSLDLMLGVKGLPKGKIIEIYGAEGCGKTSIALHTIAEAQKKGELCALIDLEYAFNPIYAAALGVEVDNLLISQPEAAEDALEIIEKLLKTGKIGLIVIDSIAAFTPQAEINGEFGDAVVGLMARLMSQAMRKLKTPVAENNVCLLFINQTRQNIATMGYGSPTTTPGGKAIKFYASMRIEVARIGSVKSGEDIIGNQVKIKVIKSRFAPPYREIKVDLIFGEGFSKEADILQKAIEMGHIKQKGAWISYNDENFAQGKENARKYLKENKEFYEEIEKLVYEG
jgi:recombination protein RecA